uniref:Leucine-rich repeat-containing N-terminal plant-type domain-containing protein n=1 Tax=Pyramimonas obovata TaxID=1411642 RepID=A0A7S0RG98_9CHLO|mmetsp:Transcript_33660/g.73485  ORF Transcript_33660/g.73485 Transcript_33660/m.73485 type:complete len:283 (+) Transcript_33660:90-938(+)
MTRTWVLLVLLLAAQCHVGEAALEDTPEWIACEANPEGCTLLEVYNRVVKGTIPTEIGLFTNLERLSLYNAQVNGTIPSEIGNLQKLTIFNVHNNYLNGRIPTEMGNMTSLVHLFAYSNFLSGNLPEELGNLHDLEALFLSKNFLRGTIPSLYGNLTSLYQFSLHRNNLTGTVPSELAQLQQLKVFFLSKNQLRGSIPTEVLDTMYSNVKRWSLCENSEMEFQELTLIDSGNKTLLCAYDSTQGTVEQQRRKLLSSASAPLSACTGVWAMAALVALFNVLFL